MAKRSEENEITAKGLDFVRTMVAEDTASGKYGGRVVTRFPPEPNGFLHIGHAKSICLNFGIAEEHGGGRCHLRFDDTNPTTEDTRYVDAIKRDIKWLGFDWGEHLYHASDYFEELYAYGEVLIRKGLAYVDSSSEEAIQEMRGSVTETGTNSPFRDRSVEENLDLYHRMRQGEFPTGAHVLRAKIDMAHPNMIMRDPILVRILHARHYRQGDAWCVYPLYDFAHCLSDSLEGITHSLCTLEFENNRAIYDWLLDNLDVPKPRPEQTEFARLNLDYTITSKRMLLSLVDEGRVEGWDDPRMPTLAGLRRRGVTPEAIRDFCEAVGVTRADSRVDLGKLEYAIRDDLNYRAPRAMAVLHPLKLTITNFPEDVVEEVVADDFPLDVGKPGKRHLAFSRTLFIERADFAEDPPPKYRRLAPGREVRLKFAYFVRCHGVVRDPDSGEIIEVLCTYDPATKGGHSPDGRKVDGTIHWVEASTSVPATIRLYDRLFSVPDPSVGEDFREHLNPESLETIRAARLESNLATARPEDRYQFERTGYFVVDPSSTPKDLVFNRTVSLRDSWAKEVFKRSKTDPSTSGPDTAGAQVSSSEGAERQATPERAATNAPSQHENLSGEERKALSALEASGLPEDLAIPLIRAEVLHRLYREALAAGTAAGASALAKWIVNDVARELGAAESIGEAAASGRPWGLLEPVPLADLVARVEAGTLGRRGGLSALAYLVEHGGSAEDAVRETALDEIDDVDVLRPLITDTLNAFPDRVEAYRGGKTGLAGFFVGQVMKASGGKANPKMVNQLVKKALDG